LMWPDRMVINTRQEVRAYRPKQAAKAEAAPDQTAATQASVESEE